MKDWIIKNGRIKKTMLIKKNKKCVKKNRNGKDK